MNWSEFGVLNDPKLVDQHSFHNPSFATFGSNIARVGYNFVDPGGLPYGVSDTVHEIRSAIALKIFNLLHKPLHPETLEPWLHFTPREDASWYGPLGFLLFWPIVIYYICFSPFLQKDIWKWSTAMTVFLYTLVFAILIRWSPWMGRMFLVPVAIGSPLLAGFYLWTEKVKALRWAISVIAIMVLSWSAVSNFHKPVIGAISIWNMDYYALRTIQEPEMGPIYRQIDENIPQDIRLGIIGPWPTMRWDYLFFGPNLRRQISFLGTTVQEINTELFNQSKIDYLVVTSPNPTFLSSETQLNPLGYGWGLYWFWVAH